MKRDPILKARSRQLRRDSTPAEARLWKELRNRRFAGIKFRRQHPIGLFIADIYCPDATLIIELDGESHLGHEQADRSRREWLESRGMKVLRFWNGDVYDNLDDVMECIFQECQRRRFGAIADPSPPPLSPGGRGEKSHSDANFTPSPAR
jgi:very-short-patch-repair endonuclease